MTLLPDRGQLLFSEKNVDVRGGGWEPDAAYDLALFRELGHLQRGVLEVTVIMNLTFKDRESGAVHEPEKSRLQRSSRATPYNDNPNWTEIEKMNFINDMRKVIRGAWSEKNRIKTSPCLPEMKMIPAVYDIGVMVNPVFGVEMSASEHSHWNVTIEKVDEAKPNMVGEDGGTFTNGTARFTSLGLESKAPSMGARQRPIVHEFGHMLGYDDEYIVKEGPRKGEPAANPYHVADYVSVMNMGETIRERHYALLTEWLNLQFGLQSVVGGDDIKWSVVGNLGRVDAVTALI